MAEAFGYRRGRNAQQAVVEVEELLFRGHSGTARRKRRQQTNQTYCHRATPRLYR
jgi:hypothetical protein